MSKDYGFRAKRRASKGVIASMVGGLIVVAALIGGFLLANQKNTDATFAAYAFKYGVGGPPCRQVNTTQLAADGPTPTHVTDYGGMHLMRAFGDVECNEIGSKTGRLKLCHFSSPGSLSAQAGQQSLIYLPGLGQPASVIIDEAGKLSCVLAPKGQD